MEKNVGGLDRTVRLVAGPVLAALGLATLSGPVPGGRLLAGALVAVGAVLLGTGLSRRCLVHRLLGVDTCSRN